MKSFLKGTWSWILNLMEFSPPPTAPPAPPPPLAEYQINLSGKVIAVAGRLLSNMDEKCPTVSCPVCSTVVLHRTRVDVDIEYQAVHLSLWHPDAVNLHWDMMQKKNQAILHLPSVIIGVGVAAASGALLSISARNRAQRLPTERRR